MAGSVRFLTAVGAGALPTSAHGKQWGALPAYGSRGGESSHPHTHTHTHTHTHRQIHAYTHTHTHTHTDTCTHTHTHTYRYMHTHTHTRTHTLFLVIEIPLDSHTQHISWSLRQVVLNTT